MKFRKKIKQLEDTKTTSKTMCIFGALSIIGGILEVFAYSEEYSIALSIIMLLVGFLLISTGYTQKNNTINEIQELKNKIKRIHNNPIYLETRGIV